MSDGDSIIGKRVKLSARGEDKQIVRRGEKTGVITGIHINGEPTMLYVLRDGLKYPMWYLAEYWTLDE